MIINSAGKNVMTLGSHFLLIGVSIVSLFFESSKSLENMLTLFKAIITFLVIFLKEIT